MPITLDDDLALLLVRTLTGGVAALTALANQGKLLQQLMDKVTQMSQTAQTTDQQFQTELAGIQADMTKQTTVTNSMLVFVKGIQDKLAAGISAAQAAGATADELAALKTLHADLNTNTQALVGASTDNTVAANEPSAPVQPTTTVDVTPASNITSGTATVTGGTGDATVTTG